MRAAGRLRYDPIDHTQLLQILSSDPHRLGGVGRFLRGAPEDGGAAFGRDHRIDAVLKHQHAVRRGDADRAPGHALAGDRGDQRHTDREALLRRAGDRLGLAPFLRLHTRKGAGRVRQGDHRQAEPIGQIHQADGLAIAFGPRHAEIVLEAARRVIAFLLADDHDAAPAQFAKAADHGGIVGEIAIAGERHEILDQPVDIIPEMRALRMAGHLGLLPGRQLRIAIAQHALGAILQAADLRLDIGLGGGRRVTQLGDPGFEFGDRFFKIEKGGHCGAGG